MGSAATEILQARTLARRELIDETRSVLRDLTARSIPLEPFEHGSFLDQLQHELLTLRIEHGDPLAAQRRARRNKKIHPGVRARVFARDNWTCKRCGYRSPPNLDDRRVANRSGLFLTIDHVIPLAEGGANSIDNMQTLCSRCNPLKGHALPPIDASD